LSPNKDSFFYFYRPYTLRKDEKITKFTPTFKFCKVGFYDFVEIWTNFWRWFGQKVGKKPTYVGKKPTFKSGSGRNKPSVYAGLRV